MGPLTKENLQVREFSLERTAAGVPLEEVDDSDEGDRHEQQGIAPIVLEAINALAAEAGGGDERNRYKEQQDITRVNLPPEVAFAKYQYRDRENRDKRCCLFNIIVALQWVPSVEFLAALRAAFREASRLLFDVTDGYMAIGQVAVGGSELMNGSDIQIFASNRLFPRSSVDAMNDPDKYRPIRLGRGLWDKNDRSTIPWSARRGFATLVHEWGHHALGLKDQYLTLSSGLVTPMNSLVKDTIMASLESSELLSPRLDRRDLGEDSEWKALRCHDRFSWLNIPQFHRKEANPPAERPIPAFFVIGEASNDSQELLFLPQDPSVNGSSIDLDHCWVYVLSEGKKGIQAPSALRAQGSFEFRPDGFRLLGARERDYVVLIGHAHGNPSTPLVLYAQIEGVGENTTAIMGEWRDATPETWPIVNVTATSNGPRPPYTIQLSITSNINWNTFTFPLGEARIVRGSRVNNLTVLDGHVLLVSNQGRMQLAIAAYSLGGSPSSGYPVHPNPIPAGSADGNAMLFFYDDRLGNLRYADLYPPPGPVVNGGLERFLIVTTTNLHGPSPLLAGAEARSYTFSVTTNQTFQGLEAYHPTLVLYYDKETRENSSDQLIICRYNQGDNSWQPIPSKDESSNYFVAAPLNPVTASRLFEDQPRPERYRLFLVR